jgi:oxygen-dependent protoporphyrinogen oxidase
MNQQCKTAIIGGGLSGLTVAHKLRLHSPNHSFLVIERNDRPGGVIRTHRENGFIAEIGPHGFLDNCPESRTILVETGLDRECVTAPLIDFVRYVYLHGQLNCIPQTPLKIVKAPLIPWSAKLRVLAELWQPVLAGEPTVAKWAKHRFGAALLPYLDAVYTGTYAGDFDRLTIDSVMPGVRALEKMHGSVLRGLFARMREKRKEADKSGKNFSMPAMTSFPGGMQRLVEKLAEPLRSGENLLPKTTVTALYPDGGSWRVVTDKGEINATNVVCALPINAALRLLAGFTSTMPLQRLGEAWINTVVFGFTDRTVIPPGFGFLTPEVEQRFALGTLFSSNMFPGRAPAGHIIIETLVGGRRHPERLTLDDDTLMQNAYDDVSDILQIKEQPVYTRILRPGGAIPQLERSYPQLLAWREKLLANHRNLFICGFGWEGIGLNDMMKTATRTAARLLAPAPRNGGEPELKGVYF